MKSITIKEDTTMVFEGNIRKASKDSKGLITTIPYDVVKLLGLNENDYTIKYTIVNKASGGMSYDIELVCKDE